MIKIGEDIIQGLINGIGNMADAVWKKAKEIANGIGDAIKDTLKIKSPSQVTTEDGEFVGDGLVVGIGSRLKAVANAGKKLAKAVIQPIDKFPEPDLPGFPTGGTGGVGYGSRGGHNGQSGTQGGSVVVHQENHFHSVKASPAEDARLQKRASQEAALEWMVR